MALIGISLIVASVVVFCLRPPAWLPTFLTNLRQGRIGGSPPDRPAVEPSPSPSPEPAEDRTHTKEDDGDEHAERQEGNGMPKLPVPVIIQEPYEEPEGETRAVDGQPQPIIQEPQLVHGDAGLNNRAALPQPVFMIHPPQVVEDTARGNNVPDVKQPAPTIQEPEPDLQDAQRRDSLGEEQEQATPKASATTRNDAVPSLVLPESSKPSVSEPTADAPPQQTIPAITMAPPPPPPPVDGTPRSPSELMPPPPPPRIPRPMSIATASTSTSSPASTSSPTRMAPPPVPRKPRTSHIPQPRSSSGTPPPRSSGTPPPPRPSGIPQPSGGRATSPRRIPTLAAVSTVSPSPKRSLPIPRRGAPPPPPTSSTTTSSISSSSGGGGGLAPPPTATSIPKKPSRQVTLTPGHSPLDWARLSSSPHSDLRNLPGGAAAPYLRVTPSMLRQQNGRKGRDAWSVFGGKVYNITPYVAFHPGGGPELLRGAGRDGTRLFAEVHPWVNYETMLQACLVGLLVEEGQGNNEMEEMD